MVPMRVAFDGTTIRPPWTGVGVYAENLLRHLEGSPGGHELVVFSNGRLEPREPLAGRSRVVLRWPIAARALWLPLVAPSVVRVIAPDVVHFTTPVAPILAERHRTVLTVHDMTMNLFPEWHPPGRREIARRLADRAIRRADACIAVSETTRRDLIRISGIEPTKVHVVPLAASDEFVPLFDEGRLRTLRERYRLGDRVLLAVGHLEPRKNLLRLVEAFSRFRRSGRTEHQLVLVGPAGWRSRELLRQIDDLGLGDSVRILGYVPQGDLAGLYSLAETMVCPSLYEGFGLPVLEAMACGRPIVASNNSSLGELLGDAGEKVDPMSVDSITDGLIRVASDVDWRLELSRRGLERARAFSWEEAARKTLAVYEGVIRG